jgi:hypothetical protein
MKKIFVLVILVLSMVFSVSAAGSISAADAYAVDATNLRLSLVNQIPNPADVGEVMTVNVGLENLGANEAKNVVLEFIPSYPFTIASGESLTSDVGTLGAFQGADSDSIKIVQFKIKIDKDASAGTYNLKFKYYDGAGNILSQQQVTIAVDAKQSAEIVKIDKTVIIPGEETDLTFTINNVGNAPLKNVKFYWENTNGIILPVGSDNTKYVNFIDVGKSADLSYKVIADTNADAGLYKLNLYLNYEESNGTTRETDTIAGVYVGGGTDFDVVYSESTGSDVSFSIANTGSNPANSVSVVIPDQKDWKVTGSNSVIIGNLNQGDYTVASFNIQNNMAAGNTTQMSAASSRNSAVPTTATNDNTGNANAAGTGRFQRNTSSSISSSNTILVQLVYTDTMGQRQTVEKNVKLSLGASTSGLNTAYTGAYGTRTVQKSFLQKYGWYLLVAIVIIAGVIIYTKSRSKKSAKIDKSSAEKKSNYFKSK